MNVETSNPTAKFEMTFDDEVVTVVLEYHFSDNAEEFIEVTDFVNAASWQVLSAMQGRDAQSHHHESA